MCPSKYDVHNKAVFAKKCCLPKDARNFVPKTRSDRLLTLEYNSTSSFLDNANVKRTSGLTDEPGLMGVSFDFSAEISARRNLICTSICGKI
jgi:hypothetical protein